jgi:hypothetical protein
LGLSDVVADTEWRRGESETERRELFVDHTLLQTRGSKGEESPVGGDTDHCPLLH